MQVQLRCQVVVDALGGFSPITKQARGGRKPDSVVLMVGSCSTGLPEVQAADLLYSFNPLNRCVHAFSRHKTTGQKELCGTASKCLQLCTALHVLLGPLRA